MVLRVWCGKVMMLEFFVNLYVFLVCWVDCGLKEIGVGKFYVVGGNRDRWLGKIFFVNCEEFI